MNLDYRQKLEKAGYSFLLPIQEKAIPAIVSGKHLFIQAETGSGKTLAYLLPVLSLTDPSSDATEALIITPTRELALQVSEVMNKLSEHHHIVTVIGGMDIHKQENALKHRPVIIIGTPGRIKDLLDQNKIRLSKTKIVILDEADQIISTGQRKETEMILKDVHAQIVCTSATKTDDVISFLPEDHEEIIQNASKINQKIDAFYIETEDRKHSLLHLLKTADIKQAIIFVNYKNDANVLSEWLQKKNILASSFSSFYEEKERIRILDRFKKGELRVLVATDAAARGLDLTDVSHIIHYDIPLDKETFIHRSGRTAHQGNTGTTITLIQKGKQDDEITQYILSVSKRYDPSQLYETNLSKPLPKQKNTVSNTMTIQIQAGRKDKLRPKDIIGALCTKLQFDEIGALEIQDSYSTVTILKNDPSLIEQLNGLSVKGKKRKIILR